MRIVHEDDGKGKVFSHEMKLDFSCENISVMAESKEECIQLMRMKVNELIQKLSSIDWNGL